MEWGETLEAEAAKSGSSFLQQSELQSEGWQRVLDDEVGNNNQKLFGGAQVRTYCGAEPSVAPLYRELLCCSAAGGCLWS